MPPRSHGTGAIRPRGAASRCPASVVIEPGALVFHPENVSLDEDVYVGHYAILKGYYKNELVVGRGALDRPGGLPARRRRHLRRRRRRHRAARLHPDLDARRARARSPDHEGRRSNSRPSCSRTAATSASAPSSCPASPSARARRSAPAPWSPPTSPAYAVVAGNPARLCARAEARRASVVRGAMSDRACRYSRHRRRLVPQRAAIDPIRDRLDTAESSRCGLACPACSRRSRWSGRGVHRQRELDDEEAVGRVARLDAQLAFAHRLRVDRSGADERVCTDRS